MKQIESEKPKIFRLIARLNTGGPARHVVWLTAGLSTTKFDSVLVCGSVLPGESDMSYFAEQNNVIPIIIPDLQRELTPRDVVSLWKVYRELLRQKPDVIHTHTAKAGALGRVAGFLYRWLTPSALVGRPRRVRFVHTYHGHVFHNYYNGTKTFVFLTIERILARLATDRILVLSEQQRREIHEEFGVGEESQFRIVPLGVDLRQFADSATRRDVFRRELKVAPDEILIGIIGRLTEVKNHALFLQVAKLWREQQKDGAPKVRFVVIGDGNLREMLETAARKMGLTNDELVFVGERKDTELFYPALDIVALTSLNEGTPLTLIEAMANARPVISTAVGGVVDLLGAQQTNAVDFEIAPRGIAVPTDDADVFLRALTILIEDKNLRDETGRRGFEYVTAHYSKDRLLTDIEKIYLELLAV